MTEFGVALPQTFHDPVQSMATLDEFIDRAEELGLHSIWVQEQMLGMDTSFEPLTSLAYVAARTDRVRLGAAAFIAPLRPAVNLAKSLATVDQFSNGRLIVGLALGDALNFYEAFGIDPAERVARLEEGVQVMTRLWTQKTVEFEGRFIRLRDAAMEPKPVQKPHPPIWFGAKRASALRRAVRLGDGWVGAGGSSIEDFEEAARFVKAELERSGKPRSSFTVAKKLYMSIADDRKQAFNDLARWFDVHWRGFGSGSELASRVGVSGTPSEVAEAIVRVQEAGADLIILNPVFDELGHLERLAHEVLPALGAARSE